MHGQYLSITDRWSDFKKSDQSRRLKQRNCRGVCRYRKLSRGESADRRAIYYGGKRGYDLSAHRARQVTMADFSLNDYILAMDWDNIRALKAIAPEDYRKKSPIVDSTIKRRKPSILIER